MKTNALCLSMMIGLQAHASDLRWTSHGPEGGRIDSATVSDGAIYASADRFIYKSMDGGTTWHSASAGLTSALPGALRIVAHPNRAQILALAGAGGAFISVDGGRNWRSKSVGLPTTAPGFATLDIAYAASASNQLWLATRAGLWRSDDAGERWTRVANTQLPERIERVAVDPNNSRRVLVWAGERNLKNHPASLYLSTDGGARFSPVAGPWDADGAARAELFAFNANVVGQFFLSGAFGSYRSPNGGSAFEDLTPQLGTARLQSLASDPLDSQRLLFGTTEGVAQSQDGGTSFVTQRGSGTQAIGEVLIDSRHNRWVAFSAEGVLVAGSTDRQWTNVGGGPRSTPIAAIAAQPPHGSILLAGVRNDRAGPTLPALYRSEDNGLTWFRSNSDLGLDTINALVYDPGNALSPMNVRVYAVGADFAPLGMPQSSYRGGVFVSSDSGRSWSAADRLVPMPTGGAAQLGQVRSLVVDTASVKQGVAQVLYFAADGRIQCDQGQAGLKVPRVWRSVDAAASWQPFDTLPVGACTPGTYAPTPTAIAIGKPGQIFVGTRANGYCASCADALPIGSNGVFVAHNGRFTEATEGLPRMSGTGAVWDVSALVVVDGRVFVGMSDPSQPGQARIYRSDDGGLRWTRQDNGISGTEVLALQADPQNRQRIYASVAGKDAAPGGVYRSDNGGLSWMPTGVGSPAVGGAGLAVSYAADGTPTVHTGTAGGTMRSTQHADSDLDGASNATESSAPNGGDGNGDGIVDAEQSGVASFVFDTEDKGEAQQGTLSDIQLNPGQEKSGTACTQIVNVASLSSETVLDDTGFVQGRLPLQFEFQNCPYALAEIIYHGYEFSGSGWQLRRYGPTVVGDSTTIAWQTVSGAVISGNRVVFPLTDNTPGDHQPQANRIFGIVAPVQPE